MTRFLVTASIGACLLLCGCGVSAVDDSSSGTLALNGTVHGGQQGVAGATIQMYAAGTSGNGRSSQALLINTPVTTDRYGFFGVTGNYICPHASDQVYIVATGGSPGTGVNNPGIAMMAALGNCGTLLTQGASRFIFMNEITTVAAAWALAPFMTGPANLGSSATNAQGMQNAFFDAGLLANTTTGAVATSSIGLTIESGKVAALADALASCINSSGSGSSSCNALFTAATPTGGTAPSDTLTAALDIVKQPGTNVAAVWNTIGSTPPFPTTLTHAPNDWTMSVTVPLAPASGSTPSAAPNALDVDANGNVWAASVNGVLNEVGPQGALLSPNGFGVGTLQESFGVAIDTSGYVWVTSREVTPAAPAAQHPAGGLTKFQGSSMSSPGSIVTSYYDASSSDKTIDYPYDVQADASGNVYIANYAGGGSATEYSTSSDTPVATGLGQGSASYPIAVAPDGTGGVWLANNTSSFLTHGLPGNSAVNITCCSEPQGVATDATGTVWAANYKPSSVSAVSAGGTVVANQVSTGGVTSPARLSVDAGGTVWVANYNGMSVSAFSSGTVAGEPAIGTALSPSGGFGLDANLIQPYDLVADGSGNLWVSNHGNNDLVMFVGLAAPTSTPTRPMPTAP